ncbi:winged helix-turn-helix transcriptional regulator [Pelosinus propionicus]|uniref:DNA-binding transcriptional regulator, HxlR family n=1 Tax=Pelosinus propionicus DSM 13327 TaxID=1123291 RepID=A0A1I4LS45_9FIRM|nr:helix-turn-helix domain-containing protein [Pelosinus propionicus]SFL93633.1 DNA-binding transcriptional regulator, HxlR family [Pelosinus propionicus DSM 13327]
MSKKSIDETYAEESLLCPIRYTIDVVGGKWKLPIICMLASGMPTRYSSIKRKLKDVTNMMLSQSLKELEASGIVHREQYNEVPPRVEYTLTDKGKSIIPPLLKLAEWGAGHMKEDPACGAFCDTCQSTN